ncbi:HAD superfamily hydrolase (TIGR01509 family)/HAD superfamily hydrolase (TIGR01549 family) [Actinocorallia herbida]|uniref:HAD superfamily hydrolase (TIGR01509 family)/HAD superfamily hydrolase (TIGR01549 family) n=1 Tax=Actinocorallia herbida TaxID=58109 RepID=A0A3N1CYT1_9ACTN|nr:HAD-IA family hydrolase [Actinocorallia herbida]ROO86386.1 HAD superfamily hydrolase (TIGR01509 family)/HAD superfamily hydrolase (TIGR01549 family) [Actinocorallia herbida]
MRRAVQDVLAERARPSSGWEKVDLYLSGARLVDFDLSGARARYGDFTGAQFHFVTRFDGAEFASRADFRLPSTGDGVASFHGPVSFEGAVLGRDALRGASSTDEAGHAGALRRLGGMDLAKIDAILFDMDGTLVDSDASVERSWTQWSAAYGAPLARVLEVAHGSPSEVTIRLLFPDWDAETVAEAAARQLAPQYEDLSDVVPTPGAHALLARLEEIAMPWAVVTSADQRLAKARLGACGIIPPLLITTDEISRGKPDPEGFLRAAAELGLPPSRCLVVEDSAPGVAAGRAAGSPVAALKGLHADLDLTGGLPDLLSLLPPR